MNPGEHLWMLIALFCRDMDFEFIERRDHSRSGRHARRDGAARPGRDERAELRRCVIAVHVIRRLPSAEWPSGRSHHSFGLRRGGEPVPAHVEVEGRVSAVGASDDPAIVRGLHRLGLELTLPLRTVARSTSGWSMRKGGFARRGGVCEPSDVRRASASRTSPSTADPLCATRDSANSLLRDFHTNEVHANDG